MKAHEKSDQHIQDLVVSCGGEDLRCFLKKAGKNATYMSHIAVIEFVEALGIWVEESLLKRLHNASNYSIMADECTDTSTVQELYIFCCWVEDSVPVEHFLEIIHLKRADAETIYSGLVDCLKLKNLQDKKIVGKYVFREQDWCSGSSEEASTPCSFCTLSLSHPTVSLCSGC